jgi:adenosylcobinamide-GDP ribazoletransferase
VTPAASALVRLPQGLAAATAFLTRIPVGRLVDVDARAVASAAPFYPVVGAGGGAFAGLAERGLSSVLPPLVVAVLLLALLTALTGAMHLDALADTADALGGRSRDDSLRIMRDHAIGAFGATALMLALLLKVAVIAALIESGDAMIALVVAGACSRAVILPLAVALPYARADERGVNLPERIGAAGAGSGVAVAIALAVLAAGALGLVAFVAALALAALAGVFYAHWLHGVTGDALGSVVELSELAALTTTVALL